MSKPVVIVEPEQLHAAPHPAPALRLEAHGRTHRGQERPKNEDHFLVAHLGLRLDVAQTSLPQGAGAGAATDGSGTLLMVADGMGGAQAGALASALAIQTTTRHLMRATQGTAGDEMDPVLRQAFERSAEVVQAEGQRDRAHQGMGTTLTVAYAVAGHLTVAHVGDSRAYLIRGDQLRQLTRDHTVAQQMVEDGVLSAERAESSRFAHVVWNAIVANEEHSLEPEVAHVSLQEDDTLLLCSDGLTKHVTDDEIALWLSSATPLDQLSRVLVDLANERGGTDNITAVVARARKKK